VILVQQPKYSFPFAASVIFHVAVLLILITSFEFNSAMPVVQNSDTDMKVISAQIVNLQALIPIEAPAPAPAREKYEVAPPKPVPEATQPKPVIPEASVQAQAQQEEQTLAIGDKLKKELLAKQADIDKKILLDKKIKLAKEKKLKQAAILNSIEKELKDNTAQSLKQQMLNEQKRVAGVKVRGEVNKYKALVLQAISQQWLVPAGVDKSLSSELLIRVAPGGAVLDVQVTKSSGVVALDRSARDAVFKASPLPVPTDVDAFEQFRQFVLKVKPKDLISSDA
jgi:colicin import membrane protein